MELGLNLLWLALCFFSLRHWVSFGRERGRSTSMVRALLALGCALLLFFPALSITDDLHAQHNVIENSSPSARKTRSCANAPATHPTTAATSAIAIPAWICLERLLDHAPALPDRVLAPAHTSRPPPASLSA